MQMYLSSTKQKTKHGEGQMSDSLLDSEILDIWKRIRGLIDLSKIKSTDKMNQKEELRKAMESPQRSDKFPMNMDTLVDHDFPDAFVQNPEIRKDLLKDRINEIKIKGVSRYQVKGGTPSSGTIRGGRFLSGKTLDDALDDLYKKSGGDQT